MVIIMKYVLTVSCTKNLKSTTTLSLSRKISDYICKKYNIIELGVLNLAEKKIEYCSGCGCCFSHGFCPLDEIRYVISPTLERRFTDAENIVT